VQYTGEYSKQPLALCTLPLHFHVYVSDVHTLVRTAVIAVAPDRDANIVVPA